VVDEVEKGPGSSYTIVAEGGGQEWEVDTVALCTGAFPQNNYMEFIGCEGYSHDYSTHAGMIERLKGDETVGVIGTHLTGIDIVVELERRGHRGGIVMGKVKWTVTIF